MNRAFDIIFSSFALVCLSPAYILIGLSILLTSKGGVFYTQQRLGKGGKPFNLYKFRTMVEDAEINGPQLATPGDDRVTSAGRFLRKYHLDELPQFWNVLKGDMAVVGPRPEREFFVKEIEKLFDNYETLFSLRPGITSLGSIEHGYATNIKQMVERALTDIDYIKRKSFKLDAAIILKTIKRMVDGKGI